MRLSVEMLGSAREPHMRVNSEQMLAMLLQPGSIEMGCRRSELTRFDYGAGEIILPRRHVETWARTDGLHYLLIGIFRRCSKSGLRWHGRRSRTAQRVQIGRQTCGCVS